MNKKKDKKRLILLDGNAIIHRAYHALPPLTTKKGELVNAVYGYTSTLLSVIEKFQPDYIVASFDLAGPTFRHKEYKEYKATRVKAPDELYQQIDRVKEVTRAFQIPIYEKEGFEADDVIGSLAKMASQKDNLEVIIVTGDLDALQLVDNNIKVYALSRGISQAILYNQEAVMERYRLKPQQLKDYKGLRGDASDNIPGVKGIGEKTTTKLLQEFQTLENVYQHLDKIAPAIKEKLLRDKSQALLSKQLGTIKTNLKLNFDWEKARWKPNQNKKIITLFQELNFFSLLKRWQKIIGQDNNSNHSEINEGVKDFKYNIIETKKEGKKIQTELSNQKEVALTKKNKMWAFSWKKGRAIAISEKELEMDFLKKWLQDNKYKKVGFEFKSLYKDLKKNYDVILRKLYFDVKIAYYLLHSGEKIEWEKMIMEELGEYKKEAGGQLGLIFSNKEEKKELCQKVDYIWKLKEKLKEELE